MAACHWGRQRQFLQHVCCRNASLTTYTLGVCLWLLCRWVGGGGVSHCAGKKKEERSGSLWDKCDYWVTCEEMAWTQATVGPSWNKASSLYLKERYIFSAPTSPSSFVHEHVSTSKHFSSAQNTHGTHIHCSVDAFPRNSGHASAVWQLHPKGRTNVFTRELFYCERRPYDADCS